MTFHSGRRAALATMVAALLAACTGTTDSPTALRPSAEMRAVAVPVQGSSTSLDIADWNIEWFGDATNGPTDEAMQQANVRDIIASADVDIWGLEEVVTASAWNTLKSGLPGYAGVLSSDANVTNGAAFYTSTEQKVAVLYKTSVATFVSAKLVCTSNDYDFAGRPPLEVTLDVNVNGAAERLVVIALHNKAFNDATSWQRRQNASGCLKSYLDTSYPTQKVVVIGDWNDDVDVSITPGKATPFADFVGDGARYTFPTKALTDAGIASTTGYPDFIDHQLATNEMMADYIASSAHVVRADQYVPNYATTTTDHYPVVSRWTVPGASTTPAVTVTSPNGGESWSAGSVQTIRWTSANVDRQLCVDASGYWIHNGEGARH
jgi:endonuclease/exonuclease/phosphatase family metal-dependent hydrolase